MGENLEQNLFSLSKYKDTPVHLGLKLLEVPYLGRRRSKDGEKAFNACKKGVSFSFHLLGTY